MRFGRLARMFVCCSLFRYLCTDRVLKDQNDSCLYEKNDKNTKKEKKKTKKVSSDTKNARDEPENVKQEL